MYAWGYPIGHTAVLGAFSKAQKSGRQGALMGWFASAGSFARIVLPVASGYMEQWADGSAFNLVLLMLAGSYLAVLLLKPWLVRMTEGLGAVEGRAARVGSEAPVQGPVAGDAGARADAGAGARAGAAVARACEAVGAAWQALPWLDRAQAAVCLALAALAVGGLGRLAPGPHDGFDRARGKEWDVDFD